MKRNPKKTGIIMSTSLARAAWMGIKTETRRLLAPQPTVNGFGKLQYMTKSLTAIWDVDRPGPDELLRICPYGQPGDLVYFKETWATARRFDHLPPSALPHDAPLFWASSKEWATSDEMGRTRSARFMPARVARRFYELEQVELQQLNRIRPADIQREGLRLEREEGEEFPQFAERLRLMFAVTWNRLHASHPTCLFEQAQWVWVLKFGEVTP